MQENSLQQLDFERRTLDARCVAGVHVQNTPCKRCSALRFPWRDAAGFTGPRAHVFLPPGWSGRDDSSLGLSLPHPPRGSGGSRGWGRGWGWGWG